MFALMVRDEQEYSLPLEVMSVTRFGGQVDYAACLCTSAVRSYSAGLR